MSSTTVAPRPSGEREWVARELHDAVGHHVSLIAVEAGTALYLLDENPEYARRALTTIAARSRDLLGEMHHLLDVLRGQEPPAPDDGAGRIRQLAADSGCAGLPVTLRMSGAVPPSVAATAHRIVQESLTNARRHAAASHAWVLVRREAAGLRVRVDDDGRGCPPAGVRAGHGLAGMHERVAALGGSLTAASRPAGGFRVSAWLPAELPTDDAQPPG